MQIETIFLDWSQPALPAAVDRLIKLHEGPEQLDLGNLLAVFPGSQAGRRFLEIFAQKTKGKLVPPKRLTVGTLPEHLYELKQPFASTLTQKLAWAEALQAIPREQLEVVIPQPPEEYDTDGWLRLADLIRRQHRELASDTLNFKAVAVEGAKLEGFNEQQRWEVLANIQQTYLDRLDELHLWDQQTARLFAIEHRECQTPKDIVLIGTVDMNKSLQAMLQQVADRQTQRIYTFVHAPAALASRFDQFGTLRAEEWSETELPINDERMKVVEGPLDQAAQIAIELAELNGNYSTEDVTICIPDERIVPHVRRQLEFHDVLSNWVIAQELTKTSPYRLLSAAADYLDSDRTDRLAVLIRHPDFASALERRGLPENWLSWWDDYVATHLQRRASRIIGSARKAKQLKQLMDHVKQLLKPLRDSARALAEWSEPIRHFLLTIFGEQELDPEQEDQRQLIHAIEILYEASREHSQIPEALSPVVTAPQAIRMTLEQVRGEFVAAKPNPDAIHLSGWLDMPLDDAPVAIVTSLNEGLIPSSVNHDLFLPNRLRTHLGLEDNQRRFARDAYALSAVLQSRELVQLIVARRDVRKEPLMPSRLIFAADEETISRRVIQCFNDEAPDLHPNVAGISTDREESNFRIPRPDADNKHDRSFRVTEFKDYLVSPYRYYLRHVLKLNEITDNVVELDPAGFGSLIHDVLERWGKGPEIQQTDPNRIAAALNAELDQLAVQRYGHDPLFPVHIQVEQIRHRLNIFAKWQAEWIRQGWETRHTEIGFGKNVTLTLADGSDIKLRGRIDRIDYHPQRDEWIIFDYKTSDRGQSPEQTHRQQKEWIDLQLPLYRHLAAAWGVKGNVRLGYITLPRTTTQIREQIADWSEQELLEADDKAKSIASSILNHEFWVEQDRPVRWFQEFAGICQDGVFEKEALL